MKKSAILQTAVARLMNKNNKTPAAFSKFDCSVPLVTTHKKGSKTNNKASADFTLCCSKQMSGDTHEMRELATRICRDYLSGAWKMVTPQNIGFKHISGGLSNLLYHISLPDHLTNKDSTTDDSNGLFGDEPKDVLIRVYGQTHGERALETLITESVIFTLLSERGLGPKLHGIFPGGRIEQYINARPLRTRELADERMSMQIAQKMASIHGMEVPLHKDPRWLWDTIERWLKTSEVRIKMGGDLPEVAKALKMVDFRAETDWLRRRLEMERCPVVFCHNDMQEGNILMCLDEKENNHNNNNNNHNNNNNNQKSSSRIVVIDFEYCSYNYRSFDIANHFIEWIYDYTVKEEPFYSETVENYPSHEQRLRFVQSYLRHYNKNRNAGSGTEESSTSALKVMKEVEVFSLASHWFWGLWGIINAETSQIPFGYWEYAVSRFNHYFKLKQKLSKSVPGKRKLDSLE